MKPRILCVVSAILLLAAAPVARADDYAPVPGSNLQKLEFGTVPAAAAKGDIHEVERLLRAGRGSVNDVDGKGNAPLTYAAMHGDAALAKLLLDRGATVDFRDKLGNTAMHLAAQHGSTEVIKLLVAAKAATDAPNREGVTPLMMAAGNGQVAAVRLLLSLGADAKRQDFTGRDAQGWAAGKPTVLQALRSGRQG